MRYCYRRVFPEPQFAATDDDSGLVEENVDKLFKVSYKINILPMIDEHVIVDENGQNQFVNEGCGFFNKCIESEELKIFNVENFQELLSFKWDTYGKSWHLVGFSAHCLYMILLTAYNYFIYIDDVEADLSEKPIRNFMEMALVVGVLYPAFYDFT